MISSSTNLSSHVRAHTSRVHISHVIIKRPQPAPCVVCGSQSSTCQPAVRWSTNIIEPCELNMHPCVLCAAKFRPRKELDNHNRAEHFWEGHFSVASAEMNFTTTRTSLTTPRRSPGFFCFQHDFLKAFLKYNGCRIFFKLKKKHIKSSFTPHHLNRDLRAFFQNTELKERVNLIPLLSRRTIYNT